MVKQRFDEKDPVEKLPLTFDFTQGLADTETLVGTPVVNVKVDFPIASADPTPSQILNGSPVLDPTNRILYVPVQGGVDGVDYDIVVEMQTSNPQKFLVLACILPVRSQ